MKQERYKDIRDYIDHCKTHYLSFHNDGFTRDYYRNELLRLKDILDETLTDTIDTLNGKGNKQ